MKKLLGIVVLGLLYFTINSSYAKDYISWGALTKSCNQFDELLENKSGEEVVKAEIRGFLSGLNTQLILEGKENFVRIINYNSIDFALDYLKVFCRKTKDNIPAAGLVKYFKTLPIFKD